tara:strand:- start:6415 stop:6891 length:477 start_codon:yes stop_codon:yes gene_type:complete
MSEINWNALDEAYKAAPKNTMSEPAPVPDGTYETRVHTVQFMVSKTGNPFLFWVLEIQEGPHEGRNILKRNMLLNPKNMSHFKKDVAACGIEPPDGLAMFSDADKRGAFCSSLLDKIIVCRKKTKGEFSDVWFQQLKQSPVEAPAKAVNTFADDDIPF